MTKHLPLQSRIEGSFTVGINGAFTNLVEGANFTDTAALLAALDAAGIAYEAVPLTALTGTASGRIRLVGTGASWTVGVNGTFSDIPMNTWFTPTAAQLEALQRAPFLTIEVEYTDQTPDAFTFTDVTDVETSSTQTSDEITVSGLGDGISVAVTITGGEYSKNGGSYTSDDGTAINGDAFTVQHTASASADTSVDTVLTIGGVSDTFTSTTTAAVEYWPQTTFDASTGLTDVGDALTVTGGHAVKGNTGDAGALQAAVSIPSGTVLSITIDITSGASVSNHVDIAFWNAALDTGVGLKRFTANGIQTQSVTLTGAAAYIWLEATDGFACSINALSITG